MSETPPPVIREHTVREVQPGMLGAVIEVGRTLVGTLPPAFLMLCIINVAFLWLVLDFVQHQSDARVQFLTRIVDRCVMAPLPRTESTAPAVALTPLQH